MDNRENNSHCSISVTRNEKHILSTVISFIKVLYSNENTKRKFDCLITTIEDLIPDCQIYLLQQKEEDNWYIIQPNAMSDSRLVSHPFPVLLNGDYRCLLNVQDDVLWMEKYAEYFPNCNSALAVKFHTIEQHYFLLIMQTERNGFSLQQQDELYALFDVMKSALYSMLQFRRVVVDKHQVQQEEKLASLGKLAAGVAHEINNPLGFVMSNFSFLDEYITQIKQHPKIHAIVDPKLHEMIADSEAILMESFEGLSRIKNIVSSLNVYSHSEENMAYIDMRDVLNSTLALIVGDLKFRAQIIYLEPDRPYYIRGSYNKLQQVFLNLIINAVQSFMNQKDGVIRIEINDIPSQGKSTAQIQVLIEDNGKGISSEHLGKVFDPFFTTRDVGEGAGLGLSVAREIISEHHGKIKLRSTEGLGTCVFVTLPQAAHAQGGS
ncbi:sensor histidine kinase [Vibrio cholerae]